jgi:hypothetical protein
MFRGSERIRLITMLGTLCILGMIIYRSLGSGEKKPPADNGEPEQTQGETAKKAANPKSLAEKETVLPGPTDEDPDELAEAENEYQVLTDGTLGVGELEMPAYCRVFGWVEHQSFADLKKRAIKDVPLDGLMRTPEKFRGKLLQIDLNVRHAIPVDGAPLGVKTVYELHGFSEESGAWMYFAIVPELPAGMPSCPNVEARVRVEGYFFKLNGYLEAGAKPRAAPLKAPLLIGRVKRLAAPSETSAAADSNWLYYAAAAFVFAGFFFSLAQFFSRRSAKRHQSQLGEFKKLRDQAPLDRVDAFSIDKSISMEDSRNNADDGFDFGKTP